MAIAFVQHAQAHQGNGQTLTVTLGSNATAGNALIVCVGLPAGYDGTIASVTLGGSADNFSQVFYVNNFNPLGSSPNAGVWVDADCAGSQTSVVITLSTTYNNWAADVYEFSGLGAAVLDKSATGFFDGTTWSSTATATTSAANELWLGMAVAGMTPLSQTITGPSSPWTNETAQEWNFSGLTYAQVTGYQIVSSTGAATYSGTTSSSGANTTAAVVTLRPGNITATGSVALSAMDTSAMATGGNTTAAGAVMLTHATAGTGTVTLTEAGATTLDLAVAATGTVAPQFPLLPLGISVQLLLNGTWTDITTWVYQRDNIVIALGKPDETSNIQPGSMTLTLNNRGGNFSPLNSSGAYYPYVGRNTQIRLSVFSASASGVIYNGFRFTGEVSSWPPKWDPTGSDVYVQISAGGVLTRYVQGGNIGSALRRFYTLKTDATAPIALWMCDEQTSATQFGNAIGQGNYMTWTGTPTLSSDSNFYGSDPIPLLSLSTWTGDTGSYSSGSSDVYTSPGTYVWTAPGTITAVSKVGCWGAGGGGGWNERCGGGGGEYAQEVSVAVTPGNDYTVVVGAGGQAGTTGGSASGQAGGDSYFTGDSVTVLANGGGGGSSSQGTAGQGSSNTTHYNGGASGSVTAHGGGSGGGGSAGTASAGNNGSNDTGLGGNGHGGPAVTGGAAGGNGGTGAVAGGLGGQPGGGGGGGGSGENGGSGGAGQVKLTYSNSTTPNNVVVRFLLDVPTTGAVNGASLVKANISAGSLTYIETYYQTTGSGTIGFRGYNGATKEFDSATSGPGSVNGKQLMISMELKTSGSNLAWQIDSIKPGAASSYASDSGTYSSATIGGVSSVVVNSAGTINDTAVGVVVVQYAYEALTAVSAALNGHNGELAGDRFLRLCSEENFTGSLIGTAAQTPQMGPQTDTTFTALLQSIEDCDRGQIIEARGFLGLYYRTRVSLQNQTANVQLNYPAAQLSGALLPAYDDQLTRNDITVSRLNGATVQTMQTTGTMSTQAPPDGVGDYTYSLQAVVYEDSQLANLAAWLLYAGTVDDYRYPGVEVDLSRPATASLFDSVPSMGLGDYYQITNPPAWIPDSPVEELLWGYTETLNAFTWTFVFNSVPESVYSYAPATNLTW